MPLTEHSQKLKEIFELEKRALQAQTEIFNSAITRASIVAAMNAFIAAAFATTALGVAPADGQVLGVWFSAFEWLAISCFLGSLAFSVLAILPRGGWKLALSPYKLQEDYCSISSEYTLSDFYEFNAIHMEENRRVNNTNLTEMLSNLTLSLILAFLQALFWIFDIRS